MYFQRFKSAKIDHLARLYPVLLVTGPRQSGKTELVKHQFAKTHRWTLLDKAAVLELARQDPGLFLKNNPYPAILDEVQKSKNLFSEIKAIVDEEKPPMGSYILTGSQPFLLMQDVSESLAGRVGIVELLPMCVSEIQKRSCTESHRLSSLLSDPPLDQRFDLPYAPSEMLLRGFFPAMALKQHSPTLPDAIQRLEDYVKTYLTRDLRELSLLRDLSSFERLMRQLALYAAQPLTLTEVAAACGVKHSTAQDWVSLLEASYLYKRIPGFHHKLGRRESKRPKGVFVDCGLTAQLLGFQNCDQLEASPLLGRIGESAGIQLVMQAFGDQCKVFHWRVDERTEVDLILEPKADELIPVEIKMTSKPSSSDLRGIEAFMGTYSNAQKGMLITLYEKCFWVSSKVLHVPLAML